MSKGTTTDPVQKAMELLPIGPVVIIDTPGIDDEGTLGEERIRRQPACWKRRILRFLSRTARAVCSLPSRELIELFRKREIPFVIAHNKADLTSVPAAMPENEIYVRAAADSNIRELKELIARAVKPTEPEKRLVADLLAPNDTVAWSCRSTQPRQRPADPAAAADHPRYSGSRRNFACHPRNRADPHAGILREPPRLVITDSQAFGHCGQAGAENVQLTSFSILFARIQRQSAAGDSRCCTAEFLCRMAILCSFSVADASPPVRRYRHGKTAELIRRFTGKVLQFLVYRG